MKINRMVATSAAALVLIASTSASAQAPKSTSANPPGVAVAPGYFMELLTDSLEFPTGVTFAPDGNIWISESGIPPTDGLRLIVVDSNGAMLDTLSAADLTSDADQLLPPLTDITYNDGWMYLSHLQVGVNGWRVGAISRFKPEDPSSTFETIITNLPSSGDHTNNEVVFDSGGRGYFAQGTATNSGVVGLDSALITGWLGTFPTFSDYPAVDLVLNGTSFVSPNPLTPDADDEAVTPPFLPFGTGPIAAGTVVSGASAATPQDGIIAGVGAVYSFDPSAAEPGTTLELEAWGMRNPFGIGLDPYHENVLFAANNGADVRGTEGEQRGPVEEFKVLGSRPIARDFDDLYRVDLTAEPQFFGWPDYYHDPASGAVLPVTDPLFCDARIAPIDCPAFVLDETFAASLNPKPAFAQFELNSSATKFDFSPDPRFRHEGDLFVAETGSFVPTTGAVEFTGYKVVSVDRQTGQVRDFIVNEGDTAAEIFDPESFNKPIDVKFRGATMYVVDFGVFEPGIGQIQRQTGKLWVVTRGRRGQGRGN